MKTVKTLALSMALGWLFSATFITGTISTSDSVVVMVLIVISFVADLASKNKY